ncbi:MAG: transporter [Sphingomonas sp.]|nr:transporter [Sphingomonas sp.]
MKPIWIVGPLALAAATPAMAQEERDYCPARPGLGDTPCTIAPGRVSVETGLADWQHDRSGGAVTDTITLADTLVRAGIGTSFEAEIGWTPYVRERVRDAGGVATGSAVGDLTLGLRKNLVHPDGSGFSITLEPLVMLPVGKAPAGAGDWSAALAIPASLALPGDFSIQSTATLAAAVDGDGHGRHFQASEVVGLGVPLTSALSFTLEGQWIRDEDPAGGTTQGYAGGSFAWSVSDDLQLDVGGALGLNHDAADTEIYAGIARRF